MTAVLVSAAVTLAVVALVLLALLLRRLQQDLEDLRAVATISALDARLGALRQELEETAPALPARRDRLEVAVSPAEDLDDVLASALAAARDGAGADAALLALNGPGAPVVATLGLARGEAERLARSLPPVTPNARSVALDYRVPAAPDSGQEPIRLGVAVPVADGGRALGLLAVLARGDAPGFGEPEVAILEDVAGRAGAAIARAVGRRDESERDALDAVTGLVGRPSFRPALERAVAEAHLRRRALSLVLLRLGRLRELRLRSGPEAVDAVLADAAARLRVAVRESDVACRLGESELAVVLPGSTAPEGRELAGRLQAAVASRSVGGSAPLAVNAGVASLARADTPEELLARAEAALAEAERLGEDVVVEAEPGR